METARHYMTILCLHCIAELHIHIQFSTIVAFPVTVPISSLFFCVSFKYPSIPFSPVLPHESLRTRKFAPSFHWDPAPSPPWPWSSCLSFQYQLSSATSILIFHNCPRSRAQLSQLSTDPSSKQLWKATSTPCVTHPFPGRSPDTPATHPLRWGLVSPDPRRENTGIR